MATESGVQNPLVIDLVGREPQFGGFVLYMFETREWKPTPERFQQPRTKVNSSLFYVTGGQLLEDHPECREKPLHFELRSVYRPDDTTMEFIRGLQEALRPHGIKLVVSVSDVLNVGH